MSPGAGSARAQAVLGAALLYGSEVQAAVESTGLREIHFEAECDRLIFSAWRACRYAGGPADVVGVLERLVAGGQAESAGGLEYLNALAQVAPPADQAEGHARALVDRYAIGRLVDRAQTLVPLLSVASPGADARDLVAQLEAAVGEFHGMRKPAVVFSAVPVLDLDTAPPEPQRWYWDGYLPVGHLMLFSGHGGAGKTTVAMMMMVALAMGLPFLGRSTQRCRVLFFSAEDPAPLVRLRLLRICREMGVEPAALAENLRVIDATEIDAALFVEQRVAGLRQGKTTPTYEALARYVEAEQIDVLVLDNASDLFDGDEIVRQLVRGFVRSLVQLVRKRGGAVCLLAHVDKATSRAGKGASSESYSGSTAWHNSARSRVVLLVLGDGQLELQHQKCNLGPRQPTVLLTWPAGGLPQMAEPDEPTPAEARPDAATAMRRLVELVRDFNERGESVSTSMRSAMSAMKLFEVDPRYPRHLAASRVEDLLRTAERSRYLVREDYTTPQRKRQQRWRVTPEGVALVDNLPLFGGEPRRGEV